MFDPLNAPQELDCVVKQAEALTEAVYIGHKDPINRNQLHLYKITHKAVDNQGSNCIAIESAYDDLQADGYIKDLRPTNRGIGQMVTEILDGTRWSVGQVTSAGTVTTNFYYENTLGSLQRAVALAGAEFKPRIVFDGRSITGRFIDIYHRIGTDRGKRYVHGSNLLEIVKEERLTSVYTALIGRGRGESILDDDGEHTGAYGRRIMFTDIAWSIASGDPVDKPSGQEFVEIPAMTQMFGFPNGKPRVGIVEFGDIEDPAQLLAATYNSLVETSRPKTYYRTDVKDFGDTATGDIVTVIRDDYDIRYKVRIQNRRVNLLNPQSVQVELGDDIVRNYMASTISKLTERLKSQEAEAISAYRTIIGQLTGFYWGEDGYTYDIEIGNEYGWPAGIYSFDKPIDQDPTKVIYFGAGKLLVANTKNPDGTWNFTSFLDGDGLAANTVTGENIVAGNITSDHINASGIVADKIQVTGNENLSQTLINLQNDNITIVKQVQEGGPNLLKNPTFGTPAIAEETGWHTGHIISLLADRFKGKTIAEMMVTLDGVTVQQFINYQY